MKKHYVAFISGLLLAFVAFTSLALVSITPEEKLLFSRNAPFLASGKIIVGNSEGNAAAVTPSGVIEVDNTGEFSFSGASTDSVQGNKYTARATWDFAVDGGATTDAIDLGVTLPANATVTHVYDYTVAQVTDGGSGTVNFYCGTANDDLVASSDITGISAGTWTEGVADNEVGNFVDIGTSACALKIQFSGVPATAGKKIYFLDYVIVE